jgi:formiminotetrahydrofolate cyclodeaminase
MKYHDYTLSQYLHELASGDATPGGGSAAALVGALGAALVSMVGNLTVGRKKYAAVEPEMHEMVQAVGKLQEQLLVLVSEDTQVFNAVMAAYQLPKGTDEEKQARSLAINEALRTACSVPLRIADASISVLELAKLAAERGNINAVSDAAVGSIAAHAALQSALLNVRINLKSLPADDWSKQTQERVAEQLRKGDALNKLVQTIASEKLSA